MKSIEINEQDNRTAMGLAANEVLSAYQAPLTSSKIANQLDLNNLAEAVENPRIDLADRLFAGSMIGLLGDTRISVLAPHMIEISGGTVSVGLAEDKAGEVIQANPSLGLHVGWILKESPCHQVRIQDYKIGKYLVTNFEYAKFVEETAWAELPTSWEFGVMPVTKQNHPVYTISPESADAYCVWLSKKTGRRFRLPTEYEWEYASSGPLALDYPWGNSWRDGICNTVELKHYSTTPVGVFPESNSHFGVTDMAGNVEEYTADNYFAYPGGSVVEDDLFKTNPNYRVARGGSFTRHKDLARSRRRHGRYAKEIYVMGFRLAESI